MNSRPTVLHRADCSIWDTPPESTPDALTEAGYGNEEIVTYLSMARPVYDALKRCLGQMGGLLLLMQVQSLETDRADLLLASVREQLKQVDDAIAALKVPAGARQHSESLARIAARLGGVRQSLERTARLVRASGGELDRLMKELFTLQQGLIRTAEPGAGLMPVDFTAACCTCQNRSRITNTSKSSVRGGTHVSILDICS